MKTEARDKRQVVVLCVPPAQRETAPPPPVPAQSVAVSPAAACTAKSVTEAKSDDHIWSDKHAHMHAVGIQ